MDLADYSILEVGEYVSVPYAGKLFADLGMDVLKVEPPGGDVARRVGPFPEGKPDPNASAFFGYLNTGKRGLTLARDDPTAADLLRDLVSSAGIDVVLESGLAAYGIDPVALSASVPDLVVVSLSGFGATGPWQEHAAPELVAMAESGHVNKMGFPDAPPLRPRIKSADYWAGQYVALSAVGALLFRGLQGGDGRHVDVSKREAAISAMEGFVSAYSWSGRTTERTGYGYPTQGDSPGHPAIFETADGYISISPITAGWEAFCTDVIERPDLLDDDRFATPARRTEHLDALREVIEAATRSRETWPLFEACQAAGVPSGVTATPTDVLALDHLGERGFWADVALPSGTPVTMPGFGIRVDGESVPMDRAPRLGEHTDEVVAGLGYDPEALRAAGVT